MGMVGMILVFVGCLIVGTALFSFCNFFGLVSKDQRYQSNTTDTRVQRTNIWILLIGLAVFAIGFIILILSGA